MISKWQICLSALRPALPFSQVPSAATAAAATLLQAVPGATCRLALNKGMVIAEALSHLERLRNLQHLRIQVNGATAPAISKCTALKQLSLKTLHVSGRRTAPWPADCEVLSVQNFALPLLPKTLQSLMVRSMDLRGTDWSGVTGNATELRSTSAHQAREWC